MNVTIMEVLQKAKFNLAETSHPDQKRVGIDQLSNAVTLLEKGYGLHDNFDLALGECAGLDSVPDKELS